MTVFCMCCECGRESKRKRGVLHLAEHFFSGSPSKIWFGMVWMDDTVDALRKELIELKREQFLQI